MMTGPKNLPPLPHNTEESMHRTLWTFDLDGTLLVSHGREIIESNGMCAGIHPLIVAHVELPVDRASDFRYCGEEDMHGDPHGLIETAAVIEPVAAILRRAVAAGGQVAILSARAHDAVWLSERLTTKFNLPRGSIRPELIQCVYSRSFEDAICCGRTPERKAAALKVLIERAKADAVHFFDDLQENIDFAVANVGTPIRLYPHLVDFDHALEALKNAGTDPLDVFHPQLRPDRINEPNALVLAINRQLSNSNLPALQQLADLHPPASPTHDDDPGRSSPWVEPIPTPPSLVDDPGVPCPPTTTSESLSASASPSSHGTAVDARPPRRRPLPP